MKDMLCTYPKEYFCSQLEFYQYTLTENTQLAPAAVPADAQTSPKPDLLCYYS